MRHRFHKDCQNIEFLDCLIENTLEIILEQNLNLVHKVLVQQSVEK